MVECTYAQGVTLRPLRRFPIQELLTKTPMQDRALVEACRQGDHDAFAKLYDLYIEKIYAYLYYRTHHRETAEDLASDVFMKAFAKIAAFDPGAGSFSSWIYRIAHNRLVDHYRGFKQVDDIEDVWDALRSDVDVNRDAETSERLQLVQKHVQALPVAQREVILLRAWDGLTYAEIAEVLGKNESACKMAFSRGLSTLKKNLGPLALFFLFLTKPL